MTHSQKIDKILNDLITERWVKPDWFQYKEEMIEWIRK